MELFFTNHIEGETAQLSEEESYHCIKILRHKASEIITFTDGEGNVYQGKIKEASSKKCSLSIINKEAGNDRRNYTVHIAIAPTKNIDRTEFFIEKAVEIGIDKITFLRCERSERKEVKIERLTKIAIAAMKQSKKTYFPNLEEVVPFKDFIKNESKNTSKYIASLVETKQKQLKDIQKFSDYLILVGPEGDFSPNEVKLAMDQGFDPLTLGNNIYRTETAGIVVCSYLQFLNQIS